MKKVLIIPAVILVVAAAMLAGRVAPAHAAVSCSLTTHPAPVAQNYNGTYYPLLWDAANSNTVAGSCSGVGGTWNMQMFAQYRDNGGTWATPDCYPSSSWPAGCRVVTGSFADNTGSGALTADYPVSSVVECTNNSHYIGLIRDWRMFVKFRDASGTTIATDHSDILAGCSLYP